MKIAIPLFGTRIAPRFDCTGKFLLVAAENGNIIARQELLTEGWTSLTRTKKLRELAVDTLICNGIDCFSSQQLNVYGIRIYSWVIGEAEEALRCFLDGRLESGVMIGSDGHQCGRWRSKEEGLHRESNQLGQGRGRGRGHEEPIRKYNHYARKEVITMPRRDGTGPMGYGPKTGLGAGSCTDNPDPNNVNQMSGGGQGKGRGQGGGQGKGRGQGGGQGKGRGQGRP